MKYGAVLIFVIGLILVNAASALVPCVKFNGTEPYADPDVCMPVLGFPFCTNVARDGLPPDVCVVVCRSQLFLLNLVSLCPMRSVQRR